MERMKTNMTIPLDRPASTRSTPLLQIEYEPMIADCSSNGTEDEQLAWLIVFLLYRPCESTHRVCAVIR